MAKKSKGKYHSVPQANPAQHMEAPGQGYSPMHGGDVLSIANAPQPGHPMTQLTANDYPQGDS